MSINISLVFKNSARDFSSGKILLAVSGGLDSMVLWHLVEKHGFSYAVAHVNYQLRGDASMADEELVSRQAKKLKVALEVKRADVAAYQKVHSGSTQMAARDLRYGWFQQLCKEKGYDYVFTAHHQDDQIETFFLNLSRGTSLKGLKGMSLQNGNIIRPLLHVSKAELLAYAKKEGVKWREDESNTTNAYKRNFIRNEIIPLFQQVNPRFNQVQQENMELISGAFKREAKAFEHLRKALIQEEDDHSWMANSDLRAEQADAYFFYELLRPFGLNYREAKDLKKAYESEGTSVIHSGTHSFWVERNRLVIRKAATEKDGKQWINASDIRFVSNGQPYQINHFKSATLRDARTKNAALDAELLQFPLLLRPWEQGDRFVPLGMKGKKKVSDFLIDEKVDAHQKSAVNVLLSGETIVWVVGHRISEDFKISSDTQEVWHAELVDH